MARSSLGPSVVAPCEHCQKDTIFLQTAYGGWRLFDAEMYPTADSFAGNRFAVTRRRRQVTDLDCVLESRWPARCLHLHKFSCPESYDEARHYKRRPRQANYVDLGDLLKRLREHQADPQEGEVLGWLG